MVPRKLKPGHTDARQHGRPVIDEPQERAFSGQTKPEHAPGDWRALVANKECHHLLAMARFDSLTDTSGARSLCLQTPPPPTWPIASSITCTLSRTAALPYASARPLMRHACSCLSTQTPRARAHTHTHTHRAHARKHERVLPGLT